MNKTFLQYTAEDILSKLDNLSEVDIFLGWMDAFLPFDSDLTA